MSADLIGLSSFIRQPEGGYEMDAKTGGWIGTVVWRGPTSSALSFAPKKNDPHPDSSSLLATQVSIQSEEGGISKIEARYEGLPSDGGSPDLLSLPEPEVELSATVSEQPIETHPSISRLSAEERNAVTKYIEDPYNYEGDTFNATQNIYWGFLTKGITSYLCPGMIFSRVSSSYSRPSGASAVGTINSPSGAPALSGGRTWLKMGSSWRRAGGYYIIQESWQSSGPAGWDSTIYNR